MPTLDEALRKIPIFADLSAEDMSWFLAHCEERHFQAGEVVFEEVDTMAFQSAIARNSE